MRILLQFPEGLKQEACAKAAELEARGHTVLISASPCFGACDVAVSQAHAVKADKLIHYGHAEFPLPKGAAGKLKIEYVEHHSVVDVLPVLRKTMQDPQFKTCKTVGLVTTVQHVPKLQDAKTFLESKGKTVLIGRHGAKAKYDGQILGCDAGSAASVDEKVDCVLYLGGGYFHPLAAAFACRKRVLAADPFLNKLTWMDEERDRRLKRRKGLMTLAIVAKNVGILVSVKPGQFSLSDALKLKKEFESVGKKASVLVTDFISSEPLENFHCFDVYVNTACPRIALDDCISYGKPMLTVGEAREVVRQMKAR